MPLLTVNNLTFSHTAKNILKSITLAVEPGERIGLVGRNGTGKTTLLRIIEGDLEPDSGEIQTTRGAKIGYLQQDTKFDPDKTIFEVTEEAFAELRKAHEKLEKLSHEMADAQGENLDRILKKYERTERKIESLGGYAVEHRIEETLHGLGFPNEQFKQKVHGLSGGERARLALAKLLLEQPDLLLLDEPTNHLDIEGRRWLEDFLINDFRGAVLIVSHDRYLLDRVVNRILETEVDGSISSYPGNYAAYRQLRYDRKLTMVREFEKQQDHVRREKEFIRRYKAGQRAKQAAGRESRLERFKNTMTEKPLELESMRLTLPKAQRTGDIVLKIENISKSFGDRSLFNDFSFTISRGDRIGIIGPNGAGKSTLIECILNRQNPDTGSSRFGANVSLGYFSQLHKNLRLDLTVWQYLQSVVKALDGSARAGEQQARDLAGAFLFSGNDQEKTLDLLSGGERSRAVLAGIVAGGHNFLVLDEPTNHFDIPSAERLEQALDAKTGFDGTVIIISHDRAFLDACVDQLFVLDGDGNISHFLGNYAQWRELVTAESRLLREMEEQEKKQQQKHIRNNKQKSNTNKKKKTKKRNTHSVGALSLMNTRKLEQRIEQIELRIKEIDQSFLEPEIQRNGKKVAKLTGERAKLIEKLEPLEFEWSRRAEEADS